MLGQENVHGPPSIGENAHPVRIFGCSLALHEENCFHVQSSLTQLRCNSAKHY